MRIELRRLQDSDEKYESIEEMPKLIDSIHGLVQGVNKLKDKLNNMDTTKSNKSKVLLVLQSLDNDIQSFEDNTSSIEKATLRLLENIRTIQEKEKKMD